MLNLLRRCALAAICLGIAAPALSQIGGIGFPPGGGTAAPNPGTLNTSCDSTQGTGCGGRETINHLEICFDGDEDGVCDGNDECLDTPAGTPVFFNGCHLQTGKAMVLNGVNFEFDRADLTISSQPVLERAVEVLQGQSEVLVTVDGHTDNLGSDAYNEKLSWERVRSVYTYFVNQGIDPARLAYRGFGESRPIMPNQNVDGSDNPAGRAANRRVELNVLDPIVFHTMKENNDDRFSNVEPGTPVTFSTLAPVAEPEPEPEPEIEQEAPAEQQAAAAPADEAKTSNEPAADAYSEFDAGADAAAEDDFYGEYGTESSAAEPAQKTEPAPAAPKETAKAPEAAAESGPAEGSASGDDYLDEFGDYGEAAEPAAEAEADENGADDEAAESDDTEDASGVEEDYEVYEYEY